MGIKSQLQEEVPPFYDNAIETMKERFEAACDEAQRRTDEFNG